MDTNTILEQLKEERDRISRAISALEEGHATGNGRRGRRPGRKPKVAATTFPSGAGAARPKRRKRKMSAAARKRISESAKARWAKAKKAGKSSL